MFRFTILDVLWASALVVLALYCFITIARLSMSPYLRVNPALQRATEARFKYEAEAERVTLLEQENAGLRRRLSEARP